MTVPLMVATDVARTYRMRQGFLGRPSEVRAVVSVSLTVARGQTLGIVGESGSGKSTTGRLVLGVEPPDAGTVRFDGAPIPLIGSPEWRAQRARMQMIYQDPLGALDRRLQIATQIREPLDIHNWQDKPAREARVAELLTRVGLTADQGRRYPHELSGGQRQRVVLARAIATTPDFLVCDEPVSALDVSIQAQVVNLLVDLQAEMGLAMMFISHDLRVVRQVSHTIAVMYLGEIVESGDADDLFAKPQHPYTRALVSAAPVAHGAKRERIVLQGDPPNPAARPSGCSFHPRCPFAMPRCAAEAPKLVEVAPGRMAACHLLSGSEPSRIAA
ncbi:MAG: ABC transporter ATP-binding protein [Beijerinckiaceae bacterium]